MGDEIVGTATHAALASQALPRATVRSLFVNREGLPEDDYVIARYRVGARSERELLDVAARVALLTALGTVTPVPGETVETRRRIGPKIFDPSHRAGEKFGDVSIALPKDLFGTEDVLTMVLNTLMFSAEYHFVHQMRLQSIDFPPSLLGKMPGPRFGVDGLRSALGVPRGPVLGLILKPRAGVSLAYVADIAYQALRGGMDVVMDDELVVDPASEQHFAARVEALVTSARRAEAESNARKCVAVNVTGRPSKCVAYATHAREAGADCVIINAFTTGTPTLADLALGGPELPIFACNVGQASITRATSEIGIEPALYTRISRLAGADAVQTGILAANAYTTDVWGPSVIALDSPLRDIAPSMPIVAGGLNIVNLWANWAGVGDDAILAAGYGALAFPGGVRAGAEAFRAVISNLACELAPTEAYSRLVKLGESHGGRMREGLETFGFDPRAFLGDTRG